MGRAIVDASVRAIVQLSAKHSQGRVEVFGKGPLHAMDTIGPPQKY